MDIVNLKHEDISVRKKIHEDVFIKFHNKKEIYFSVAAIKGFGLAKGLYVHFLDDNDRWFFYVSDDPDGFELHRGGTKSTLAVFNQSLITLFCKRTRCEVPCKFPLKLTTAKKNGCHLIEIDLKRPLWLEKYANQK